MSDISMCADGADCPKRETCYRWTAKPNEYWQAYGRFYKPDGECSYYCPNDKKTTEE